MKIRALFFASIREITGCKEMEFDISEGTRVGQFRRELVDRYPGMAPLEKVLSVAVNAEYADDDVVLMPDAEVALIPPVSGGGHV